MSRIEKAKECLPTAFLIMVFPQLDQFVTALIPTVKDGELTGIDIMGMKDTKSCEPYHMRKEFLTDLFAAHLKKTPKDVLLHIRPLQEPLFLRPRKNGTWRCLIKDPKNPDRLLTVEHVTVQGKRPMTLMFSIHTSFRADAIGPPVYSNITLEAPAAFSKQLQEMCESSSS